MQSNKGNNFIIEFIRVADSVKVSAVCPITGVEASIIAPVKGVSQKQMQDLAVQKLKYVLNKKNSGQW